MCGVARPTHRGMRAGELVERGADRARFWMLENEVGKFVVFLPEPITVGTERQIAVGEGADDDPGRVDVNVALEAVRGNHVELPVILERHVEAAIGKLEEVPPAAAIGVVVQVHHVEKRVLQSNWSE
jgi:hypothetical protein